MAEAQPGFVLFLTGLPASGKSTLARGLHERLEHESGRPVTLLDGDVIRRQFSADLGYTKADRDTQVRRVSEQAARIARAGGIAICAVIAPYDAARREARARVEAGARFVLIFVSAPLATCESRDPKGLYKRARAGEIPQFTGVSDPYEPPQDADVTIDTVVLSPEEATARVMGYLARNRLA